METIAIVVMSLDGCLTKHDTDGPDFASPADQNFFRRTLATFDCALMGGASYRAARERILANPRPNHLRMVLTRTPANYQQDAKPGALEFRSDEPAEALVRLRTRGLQRCALVGGARLITGALTAKLLDQLWITVEPVVFGQGRRLVEGALNAHFELLGAGSIGPNTLLLRYRPVP